MDIFSIHFFYEDINFKLRNPESILTWFQNLSDHYCFKIANINYIFCSDDYLLKINQEYLDHDYYTDIISFPYAEHPEPIEGDIFISIDRVKENATELEIDFQKELSRVMAHGLLHFLGYRDHTEEEKVMMRVKEEELMGMKN